MEGVRESFFNHQSSNLYQLYKQLVILEQSFKHDMPKLAHVINQVNDMPKLAHVINQDIMIESRTIN